MATKTGTFLEHIKDLLQEQSIPSEINQRAIDNKIDTLFVPFEGTNLGLTITYMSSNDFKGEGVEQNIGLVQYHIPFPISVEKNQMASIAEFIQRLNLSAPLPGWILDRANNAVHFRYVQLCGSTPPSDDLFRYVMNIFSFYMTTYVPILVDLCTGKIQLDEATNKVNNVTR